jgi:hypothetical protein
MTAAAGATGARSWLQAQHASWLTERRLKIATVSIFTAAVLGSTVTLSGSTPPAHPGTNSTQHTVPAKTDR